MCDAATPAMILATLLPLRLAAIALVGPPPPDHHLRVFLLRRPRHHGRDLLERKAVRRGELRGEIDVPAQLQHSIPVAPEYRLFLGLGHRPLVEIGALIRLE